MGEIKGRAFKVWRDVNKEDMVMVKKEQETAVEALEGKENILALVAMLKEEWKFRDEHFTSTFWRFAYISLIVTFLPMVIGQWEISLVNAVPGYIYSIAGILFSLLGLYICIGLEKRIVALDMTYDRILQELPRQYQIQKLDQLRNGKFFKVRLNYVLCISVFSILILLGILNIILELL